VTGVPRCMSTQHPDNVDPPFFADAPALSGEDEIEEAYYAYSHLGCDEQMWDAEGKEVDGFVVKKLLGKYPSFFDANRLGRDIRLTLRVPNPAVETTEAKILLETLESIARSSDATRPFYDGATPPIFEVILPMTTSARELNRIYRYYRDIVVGKQTQRLGDDDITVAEWVGSFEPEHIEVIPLYEDLDNMLAADRITEEYLRDKDVTTQRVFLARSDPAMNYGMLAAILMAKIALRRLHELEERSGVKIAPILGVGSAPFRGGLTPDAVDQIMANHPSVHTFTVQSAFKYDHPPGMVRDAIARIRAHTPSMPPAVDEERCIEIINRTAQAYRKHVVELAPVVQRLARFVPARRTRKLHVGLFGYARDVAGVSLPRAISFTAALYSVGLPPEVLGIEALTKDDHAFLSEAAPRMMFNLRRAGRYLRADSDLVPPEVARAARELYLCDEPDEEHHALTAEIADGARGTDTADLAPAMLRAARQRRFLG